MHNLGKNQWKVNNSTSEIKFKLQLNLSFSYFYRWISNTFSELMDGQLSIGFFDVVRDLHDTQLALLCLICWLSDVSVNHLHSTYCQSRSLPSNVRFPYPQNFRSKSDKTSVYKHDWNSFILYLFLVQTEVACFVVKSAIVIFVFFAAQLDQREFTFVNFPGYKVIFSSRVYFGSQPTA